MTMMEFALQALVLATIIVTIKKSYGSYFAHWIEAMKKWCSFPCFLTNILRSL